MYVILYVFYVTHALSWLALVASEEIPILRRTKHEFEESYIGDTLSQKKDKQMLFQHNRHAKLTQNLRNSDKVQLCSH